MRLLAHDLHAPQSGSPFERALDEVLADGDAVLACPFIHLSVLAPKLDGLERWRLLTDLEAWLAILPRRSARVRLKAWWLAHRPQVRNLPGLHAKVAVGRRSAMMGSANFTTKGLHGRVEAGVWTDDLTAVHELRQWFDACWDVAFDLDRTAINWAIDSLTSTPPRPAPTKGSPPRPKSIGGNPIKTKRPEAVDDRPAQSETQRVATLLRDRVSRAWASNYFDWLADLVLTAGLPESNRQLTTTLINRDRCIGVNVNNRTALTWRSGRWKQPPRMWYLLPRAYAERLQSTQPADVHKVYALHDGDEAQPLNLLVAAFPPPASFGDPEEFREQWRTAIRLEVARKRGHSPRGQGKHVPLIRRMAVDRRVRLDVFDEAYEDKSGVADQTPRAKKDRVYHPPRQPTLEQFERGLNALTGSLPAEERELLVRQYRCPNHTAYASDLARLCGINHHAVVNRLYTQAAKRFCRATGFPPNVRDDGTTQWWTVWSFGHDFGKGWFAWELHPDLVVTMEQLGWV